MPGKARTSEGDARPIPPNHIRAWRLYRGLTLEQLSELAQLSPPQISDVETGKGDVTGRTLLALATALQTTPAALLGDDPGKNQEFWDIWETLDAAGRRRAIAHVRAVKETAALN